MGKDLKGDASVHPGETVRNRTGAPTVIQRYREIFVYCEPVPSQLYRPFKEFRPRKPPVFLMQVLPTTQLSRNSDSCDVFQQLNNEKVAKRDERTESANRRSHGVCGVHVHPQVARPRSGFTEVDLGDCQQSSRKTVVYVTEVPCRMMPFPPVLQSEPYTVNVSKYCRIYASWYFDWIHSQSEPTSTNTGMVGSDGPNAQRAGNDLGYGNQSISTIVSSRRDNPQRQPRFHLA